MLRAILRPAAGRPPCGGRGFGTSPRRHLHPFLWVVVKPVLKLAAVLSGRGFRKWWKDLPSDKRKLFLDALKRNKNAIGASVAAGGGISWVYYVSHLEETPITKRKRFVAFSPQQLQKLDALELQQVLRQVKGQLLPPQHPSTYRVAGVVQRIVNANGDIEEMKHRMWSIAVIASPTENAFVLPSGYVFVFTGMLNLCSNDDQLGAVLAHEMAHCILNHGMENLSFTHLLDLLAIVVIAALWAMLPSDAASLLSHWLFQKFMSIFLQLPYSRQIETEADEVGLQLAAKACFDVRESSAFWAKMAILKNAFGGQGGGEIEFLSTHPSHEARSQHLDAIMEKGLSLRRAAGCPPLRGPDPRTTVTAAASKLAVDRPRIFAVPS